MTEPTGRVVEDERGLRANFDDIEIGKDLGDMKVTYTQQQVDEYCVRTESYHEWYSLGSPFGGTIVPLMVAHPSPRAMLSRTYNIRGLFYKWGWENFEPIPVGKELTMTGHIVDKWVRNEREYVAYECECHDSEGTLIFRSRREYVLDFITRDKPRAIRAVEA